MLQEISGPEFCSRKIKSETDKAHSFLETGNDLTVIRDQKWYEPQWPTFAAYCKDFPRSQAYISKVMGIYKTFVLDYKIPNNVLADIGMATLSEILPYCTNREETIEWIEAVKVFTRTELRDVLKRERALPVDKDII